MNCKHEFERTARRRYNDGRIEQNEVCLLCGEEILEFRTRVYGKELYAGARRLPNKLHKRIAPDTVDNHRSRLLKLWNPHDYKQKEFQNGISAISTVA